MAQRLENQSPNIEVEGFNPECTDFALCFLCLLKLK